MGTRQLAPCRSCAGALGDQQIASGHGSPFTQGGGSTGIQEIAQGVAARQGGGCGRGLIPDTIQVTGWNQFRLGPDVGTPGPINEPRQDMPHLVVAGRGGGGPVGRCRAGGGGGGPTPPGGGAGGGGGGGGGLPPPDTIQVTGWNQFRLGPDVGTPGPINEPRQDMPHPVVAEGVIGGERIIVIGLID